MAEDFSLFLQPTSEKKGEVKQLNTDEDRETHHSDELASASKNLVELLQCQNLPRFSRSPHVRNEAEPCNRLNKCFTEPNKIELNPNSMIKSLC